MTLRKTPHPQFTHDDYKRLEAVSIKQALQDERLRLVRWSIIALRDRMVACGLENSVKEAAYRTKHDMVQALAEHHVLERY
jgi:hypothetical protein